MGRRVKSSAATTRYFCAAPMPGTRPISTKRRRSQITNINTNFGGSERLTLACREVGRTNNPFASRLGRG
jgi:hypothetical protein